MEMVLSTPELAEYSLNAAVAGSVIPGWLRRLDFPNNGQEAVALFNAHVGPYFELKIESNGSVVNTRRQC